MLIGLGAFGLGYVVYARFIARLFTGFPESVVPAWSAIQNYDSESGCRNGIKAVTNAATGSTIEDQT